MASERKKRESGATTLFARYPSLQKLGRLLKKKVPFVQQLSATECGAACLTMVLGYFGKEMGLEEVRDICGPARDGVSALSLLRAGEPLGLRGRGIKVEMNQLDMLEPGATILHWQFAHFVVLTGVQRKFVEINDPGVGPRKIPIEQFRRDFTGVALVFEPTQLFTVQKRKRVLYATIKKLIASSGLVPKIILLSLVLQVFHLAMPVLTGQVIDRVLPRGDMNLLVVLMIGLGAMVIFQSIGNLVRSQLLLHMTTVLDVRMTLGFLDHLVTLPFSYFQLRGSADLMQRMNSNAVVRDHLTSSVLSVILDALFVVVYLGILIAGSTTMALVALVVGLVDVAVFMVASKQQRALMSQGIEVTTKAHAYEMEMLNAIETLKSSGNEQRAVAHWSNLFIDSVNLSLRKARLTMTTDALLGVLKAAGPLAIVSVGAIECMSGRLTLGSMLALNAVTGEFLGPLLGLVGVGASFQTVRMYLERVNDVLEAEPEQEPGKKRPSPRLAGGIELEKVSFRYGKDGPMVVDNVSVQIKPKQFVAVVGRSGSGKSTLANLILGLYKPLTGRILFDGHDMCEVDLRNLRQQLGIVNQKLSLFGATIRDNIALSDPSLALEEVAAAAKLACVHDDIIAMPLGYSTPLVDGGGAISGGQKQRLALARALVRKPAVLLLDEATSALDALTEAQVQKSLDELQCTRIVIAHRLSTIRKADVILVVEKGQVIESGDHETLVANNGFYARLVATQLGGQQGQSAGHADAANHHVAPEAPAARPSDEPTSGSRKNNAAALAPAATPVSSRLPPPLPMATVTGGHAPPPLPADDFAPRPSVPGASRPGSVLSSAQRAKLTGFRPQTPGGDGQPGE